MNNAYKVRFYMDLRIREMIVYASNRMMAKKIFRDYMDGIDGVGDIVQICEVENKMTVKERIYTNAWDYFVQTDDCIMWDYLREQVKNGNITQDEAEDIADDIITAYQESED